MRDFVGKTAPTKKIDFMGEAASLEIRKMTGAEVKEFQAFLKTGVKKLPEETQGVAIQDWLVRKAVPGAAALSTEEMDSFPFDELASVAKEILIYSGLSPAEGASAGNAA